MDVGLHDITVDFGQFRALDRVDFDAKAGAIHALVGENGAGKTTLMKVLFGAVTLSEGTVEIDGIAVPLRRTSDAMNAGIGMVAQHYSVIGALTCLQNLVLGSEPGWFLSQATSLRKAEELAEKMGYKFDWNAPAEGLSPAGKQKLEILKLLWRNAKTMILDEPTAMLSPADSDSLFASLKGLAEQGANIIVVTHRLPEVIDHCQTVTVLRGGKNVVAKPVAETSASELAELMVGHSVDRPVKQPVVGEARLCVHGLTVRNGSAHGAVSSADLTIRSGEILGLAGVDGNGQRELIQALVGTIRPTSGSIFFDGVDWSSFRTRQRLAVGLRLIPEDRTFEGLVEEWSLTENAALGLQRLAPFADGKWTDPEGGREAAKRIADRFDTKHSGLDRPISGLSGGNQQRFVAARALEIAPTLILAFQPTRGLDIDGTARVFSAIRDACRHGACALIVSFDLDEILENCDSVVVMSKGKVLRPAADQAMDRQAIGRLMVGAA